MPLIDGMSVMPLIDGMSLIDGMDEGEADGEALWLVSDELDELQPASTRPSRPTAASETEKRMEADFIGTPSRHAHDSAAPRGGTQRRSRWM
jgi:hypothetical protein